MSGEWYEPPLLANGQADVVQLARDLALRVHVVGDYLIDLHTIMADMAIELPKHGRLTELFGEMVERLQVIKGSWDYADDALLTVAQLKTLETRKPLP